MRTNWATVLLPLAIVVGAAASACGSDDDAGTTTTSSTTSVTDGAPAPAPGAASGGAGPAGGSPTTARAVPAPALTASPGTTAPAPTTAAPDAGLVLLPEGLDVVAFGASMTETVDVLTAVIGPPTSVGQAFQDGPTSFRNWAAWEHLHLDFSGSSADVTFSGYEFGRQFVDTNGNSTEHDSWEPNEWQAVTATTDGLTTGSPTSDLATDHPALYQPDCGRPLVAVEMASGAAAPGQQLFLQPQEQGLYVRLAADGTIFSIGAQARPNPMLCDGAG